MNKIVITGGAGYIGAHVVRLLLEQNNEIVVIDDLSYGLKSRIGSAKLVELDLANEQELPNLTKALEGASAVVHFAARKQVGESVQKPAWYYKQNISGFANLLLAIEKAKVPNLIFSSSAAVYGNPPISKVSETVECLPVNPYGETKLICEWMSKDAARAFGLKTIALRYFNVAGSGWNDLGDMAALNLIPMVFEALQKGVKPQINGTDYNTPDGTCVRDYIHVYDLAQAHICALNYLSKIDIKGLESSKYSSLIEVANTKNTQYGYFDAFNVGTGTGASVKEIIDLIQEVSGLDFEVILAPRRAGDPASLIGDPTKIKEVLGWSSNKNNSEIIKSAWAAFEYKNKK